MSEENLDYLKNGIKDLKQAFDVQVANLDRIAQSSFSLDITHNIIGSQRVKDQLVLNFDPIYSKSDVSKSLDTFDLGDVVYSIEAGKDLLYVGHLATPRDNIRLIGSKLSEFIKFCEESIPKCEDGYKLSISGLSYFARFKDQVDQPIFRVVPLYRTNDADSIAFLKSLVK